MNNIIFVCLHRSRSSALLIFVAVYTNVLKADYLEELAHADEHEVVTQVQEYYADYFPIHNNVFSFNIDTSVALSPTAYQNTLDRTCDGLSAILLSLKRKPLIRYEKSSTDATKIAQELVVCSFCYLKGLKVLIGLLEEDECQRRAKPLQFRA